MGAAISTNGLFKGFDGHAPNVYDAISCLAAPTVTDSKEVVGADTPLFEAVNGLWWRQRGAIPVTDAGRLIGCFSEDDLLRICLESLRSRRDILEREGPDVRIWDGLLEDLRVRDVMTPVTDLAVVGETATLLRGIRATFEENAQGISRRHVFVVDAVGNLLRVISMRGVCRYLIGVYEGAPLTGLFERVEDSDTVRRRTREILDLPVGLIRAHTAFGHKPVVASIEDAGEAMLDKMWRGRRGYVLVTFFDGAPQGICTRRDLMRALRRPYAKLRDLAVDKLMSAQVKASSRLITLGGVFKSMAIGGYRHMPLVDARGEVECVLSMWEGVTLLAGRENEL